MTFSTVGQQFPERPEQAGWAEHCTESDVVPVVGAGAGTGVELTVGAGVPPGGAW